MPRAIPSRRLPRHHLLPHRTARHRAHGSGIKPLRTSDLVLALLGVVLLGGLALLAALALTAGASAA
ncbi:MULTISPECIES: hypothetical protein [Methylobacterium]|jgi:hypothetical protein|uniref:Uncharacterized protein n=1 Tax=Methylobacterium hispanicum TaxID=270350 RepID=A0AAV4ZQ52_9HYPH|nr:MULTISPECIES: hypothetical protein [Methylobacterium]GJD90268.1 hypothetical protein BHAOGJBA_3806 [Methylobacterium hispanicum]